MRFTLLETKLAIAKALRVVEIQRCEKTEVRQRHVHVLSLTRHISRSLFGWGNWPFSPVRTVSRSASFVDLSEQRPRTLRQFFYPEKCKVNKTDQAVEIQSHFLQRPLEGFLSIGWISFGVRKEKKDRVCVCVSSIFLLILASFSLAAETQTLMETLPRSFQGHERKRRGCAFVLSDDIGCGGML